MAQKYNVCLCNDSFPPVIDGVANAVLNYARVISEKYARVTVATPQYPDVEDDYPFTVVRYPSFDTTAAFGYRTGYPFAPASLVELSGIDFQIIHSHCPVVSTVLARTLRETKDVPIVFTYHTKFDIDIANAVRLGFLQNIAVRALVDNVLACDEVWVVSDGAGENLRRLGYSGEYRVMSNGVDIRPGRVSEEETAALDSQYGLSADEPLFLFVGRMMWYKGIRLILDGMAAAKAAGLRFRMAFVGGGGDFDEIRETAGKLGLADRCIFTGPVYDREALRVWFCRADLFLFPSTFDTNGLVVREAAACSLGSALVRGSCAAEGVTDGENGVLIEENADSVYRLIRHICEGDREGLRRIGENARRDLYVSWDSAVACAYDRYGAVIENYKSGKYRRERQRAEAPYRAVAQTVEGLERFQKARLEAAAKRADKQVRAYERYL